MALGVTPHPGAALRVMAADTEGYSVIATHPLSSQVCALDMGRGGTGRIDCDATSVDEVVNRRLQTSIHEGIRQLVAAQERYLTRHHRYASDMAALEPLLLPPNVDLTFQTGGLLEYTIHGAHPDYDQQCSLRVTPDGQGTIACAVEVTPQSHAATPAAPSQ